jgi:hypothetical protein
MRSLLWREKPRELGHLPDLRHLFCYPCLEPRIPFGDLRRLLLQLSILVPDFAVQGFERAVLFGDELVRLLRAACRLEEIALGRLLLSVITVTVPPAATRRRRIRNQRPSGA